MHTPGPAAGAARAASHLRKCLLYADAPRLCFLAGDDLADPLVARKRRNILPKRMHLEHLHHRLSQISRHLVYHTTSEFGHDGIASSCFKWTGWLVRGKNNASR